MDNKKKILIIEDEPAMLGILHDNFADNNFEVITAKNGEEGLTTALEKHPDVILLDVLMPKVDGLTLIKNLREDSWGKNVPVIILSNVSPDSNATIDAIVKYQPAYYLMKSDIKLDFLLEKVKEVLGL